MPFDVVGQIGRVERIAAGAGIRAKGRWRKLKGVALIRLPDGTIRKAELHWYVAQGIGKKEIKLKRYLD
jgi:hypothetical protein